MSNFINCEKCHNLIWTKESHKCYKFLYNFDSWKTPEQWETAYALSADEIAEKSVKYDWNQDPCDPRHVEEVVTVVNEAGKAFTYEVTAEATVEFRVREMEG